MYKRSTTSSAFATAQLERIQRLTAEVAELEIQIGHHDADAIVRKHIDTLHSYNEIKDATQALIGQYAVLTGSTVKELHETLGLSLTE